MKTVRALLGVGVLVLGVYMMWTMIPPYFNNYKLQDIIADEARMNTYTPKTEDQMRETIYQKAKDMDIPLTREQIAVQRAPNGVSIEVNYTVHIEYPIHPVDLSFHDSSKNKGI